jgi:hypothetical protein
VRRWRWKERRENEGKEARNQVLRGDYSWSNITNVDKQSNCAYTHNLKQDLKHEYRTRKKNKKKNNDFGTHTNERERKKGRDKMCAQDGARTRERTSE